MYRFNGSIKGVKVTGTSGLIQSIGQPRGRKNGGIIGNDRLDTNLDNNVNKTSGIWDLGGLVAVNHDIVTVQVTDNSYYTSQPSYQAFQETSRTYAGGGYRWFPSAASDGCGQPTWPDGSFSQYTRVWTQVGSVNCSGWIFDIYDVQGYYYTVYPPPIYTEDIVYTDITTTYKVWNFF